MSNLIRQKIKNGEGYIEIETLGIIKASEYNQLTDPQWDKTINDYQDQIDFLNDEFDLNKNKILDEIINLKNDIINIEQELESENLNILYDKLKTEEKKFNLFHPDIRVVEREEIKFQNDSIIKNLESQVNEIKNNIFLRIKIKEKEIDEKKLEINNLENNLENRLIEISNILQAERVPLNIDYLNNQRLKIIRIFAQDDYKEIEGELILLTEEEKKEKIKKKKKKEIALLLQQLYPEKVINGTLEELYNEKCLEIDALDIIEDIKNYKL